MKGVVLTDEILNKHAMAYLEGVDYCFSFLKNGQEIPWTSRNKERKLGTRVFADVDAMKYVNAVISAHECLKQKFVGGILTAPPNVLEEAADEIDRARGVVAQSHREKVDQVMGQIFCYDQFLAGKGLAKTKARSPNVFFRRSGWGAKEFVAAINVGACLYCNFEKANAYTSVEGKRRNPPFDHYLAQARYPYLGISIQNLIPCCTPCNTQHKGMAYWSLSSFAHPYVDDMDAQLEFWAKVSNPRVFDGAAQKGDVVIALFRKESNRSCQARRVATKLEIVERNNADGGLLAARFIAQMHDLPEERKRDLLNMGISSRDYNRVCISLGIPSEREEINSAIDVKLKLDLLNEFVKRKGRL